MAHPDASTQPVSMRLPATDLAIIDRAANLRGRSRTDFVREAAVDAAEAVLLEHRMVRMGAEGFAAFLAAIAKPAEVVPELVEIIGRTAPWEREGAGGQD